MDAQDIRNLQEAYMEVVENQQLDEMPYQVMGSPDGKKEKKIGKPVKSRKYADARAAELEDTHKKTGGKYRSQYVEDYDLYDIILSHLLDEGYADTEQAATAIMGNMSEEWRESIMIAEGMTMKDFKANRQKNKRRSASADAEKRGHVGKEWYNSGRRYSPDEAKRSRANMDDEERRTRHRSAVDPDNEDDNNYSADKTKNPKKLRKQKAMGELG